MVKLILFSVRITDVLKKRIKVFCAKNGITVETFIREAIVDRLDRE